MTVTAAIIANSDYVTAAIIANSKYVTTAIIANSDYVTAAVAKPNSIGKATSHMHVKDAANSDYVPATTSPNCTTKSTKR